MKNISICIPTFNRAESLRICLDHLKTFASQDFEVVIGDNASADHTANVVRDFEGSFGRLVYLKRPENVGFARNMDSVLRRASRDYVYIISDDDLVYEHALLLMQSILDASPAVVAVTGRYNSTRRPDAGFAVDYSDAVATVIERGHHAGLFANLHYCDGHPFMRREAFVRHGAYHDRTGALIPLYMKLLQHGNLVVIDKPVFQHVTSTVSVTTGMTEAWFIDMGMADLELVAASLGEVAGWNLWEARAKLTRLFYFQAARMAWNKGDHALLWLYLNRCKAVGVASDELLAKCEYAFMHEFVVQRVGRLVADACCERVLYDESDLTRVLVPALRATLPGLAFEAWDPRAPASEAALMLVDRADRHAREVPPELALIAVHDVAANLRITAHPAELGVEGGRLMLRFTEAAAYDRLRENTGNFQRLCALYSADSGVPPSEASNP